MNRRSTKTDNKSIANKIFLRENAIRGLDGVRVLDLFAGRNVLWRNIPTDRYFGIELEKGKGKNLQADTRDVLSHLNLEEFNVIDCDCYGVPFDIVKRLFESKKLRPGTTVIYTAIANEFTTLQNAVREEFGFASFYHKAPSLFNARALDFFYEFLAQNNVAEVFYYEIKDHFYKHYGYFRI